MSNRRWIIVLLLITIISAGPMLSTAGAPSRAVPPAPNNVQAEPMDEKIRITWDYPTGFSGEDLVGFILYKGTLPDSVDLIVKNDLGPYELSYTDSTVINGNTYYYSISAINDDGAGPKSTPVMAVPRGPASPPTNFSSIHGANHLFLSWEEPEDENGSPLEGYSLFKGLSKTNVSTRIDLGMKTNYTDSGLINGVTYFYQVLAITAYGDGRKTTVLSDSPRTTPSPPSNLTITPGDGMVTLSWNVSLDDGGAMITGYRIFRSEQYEVPEPLATVSEGTTYTDEDVENGVTYLYAVAGMNSEGGGERTPAIPATPLGVPSKPRNLTLKPGNTNMTLRWEEPEFDGGTPILGYHVYTKHFDENEMKLAGDAGNVFEYTIEDLVNNEYYYFQVRAYNEVGEGPGSETLMKRPEPLPLTPENFRTIDMDGMVKLMWSKPYYGGEYPYQEILIYRGTSEDELELLANISAELSSYYDTDVVVGTVYYYEVSITSIIGEGERTPTMTGRPFSRPSTVRNLRVTSDSGVVFLTWDPPEKNGGRVLEGYKIFRGTSEDSITILETVSPTQLYFNDTTVTDGTVYYYGVSAFNRELEGNTTDIVEIMPTGPPKDPVTLQGVLDIANMTITLHWKAPMSDGGAEVTGYVVYRGLERNNLTVIGRTGNETSYNDTDIERGIGYYYSIAAENSKGEGVRTPVIFVEVPVKETDGGEKESKMVLWVVLISIIVVIMALVIVAAAINSKKKKNENEEDVPQLEESEAEREERLIQERRKMMAQYTDVPISTVEAHNLSSEEAPPAPTFEDLYGNLTPEQKAEEYAKLYGDTSNDSGEQEGEIPGGNVNEVPVASENVAEAPVYQPPQSENRVVPENEDRSNPTSDDTVTS